MLDMRPSHSWQRLPSYVLAVATVGLVTLMLFTALADTGNQFKLPIVILAYLLVINILTLLAGFWPGIASAVVAFLCFNYYFIEPRGTLLVTHIADVIVLGVFFMVAVVNSRLLGYVQRRAIESAQRERDTARFYELSLALVGSQQIGEIAELLAQRLHVILHAQRIELSLRLFADETPVVASAGKLTTKTAGGLAYTVPIATAGVTLGHVQVWRVTALSTGEQRLLRTLAAETALVLDRTRTARTETRAQVLEESDRLKTALLGSVSHELRTPLATIRAGAESLRRGLVLPGSREGRELLDDVCDGAQRLTRLVDNMLDMSRIESGALHPQREWVDLIDIIDGTLEHLSDDLGRHRLTLDVPETVPLIPADPVQLDQVFTNLINNSIKYAPTGTLITLQVVTQAVEKLVQVQLSNQCQRLSADDLSRIFDKFYRLTHAERVQGAGLGLSICKGIIEAHGGRLWAENWSGSEPGLRFNFTLPLTWDGAEPRLPPPEAQPQLHRQAQETLA